MNNRLQRDVPSEVLKRIHEFAGDLAYGVATGLWNSRILVSASTGGDSWMPETGYPPDRSEFNTFLTEKWGDSPPTVQMLMSLGYLTQVDKSHYLLTEKAFRLLEIPDTPPTVFISYKRDQSAALALLVEARLKMADLPNPFVDKNLVAGDPWHGRLEATIRDCDYFICLIGPQTLDSEWVQKELRWASHHGCTIISIWHDCRIGDYGVHVPADCQAILNTPHAIGVTFSGSAGNVHSALDYETAISQLLNAMQFSTY